MKALILNSGLGKRMGELTKQLPKCLTKISEEETILKRQLEILEDVGINEIIITTGLFHEEIVEYCNKLGLNHRYTFIKNERYADTNYIYSIYLAREQLCDDVLLLHGDLVFENEAVDTLLSSEGSAVVISSTTRLPEKDFKAVVVDGRVKKIGVEFFDLAVATAPIYKLKKDDLRLWLAEIENFIKAERVEVYAEVALNNVLEDFVLSPVDVRGLLCKEIDNISDLSEVKERLREINERMVYLCFSTDIVHSGHISLIKRAKRLGNLIIGVLSDEAVASYKRFPLVPFTERKVMFENICGVSKVVEQSTLSYRNNLLKYRPNYVVHGDDWREGAQKQIRDEVNEVLATYGGRLVEFPYNRNSLYEEIEKNAIRELQTPDLRRSRLRKLLSMKGLVRVLEAHSGLTGLIVENTQVVKGAAVHQFDAMWISSLCDSTLRGKPDIELVDMTSRFRTVDDILEVTTKPIIFDGDTGGLTEHFVYTVRSLERMGVSMVIIEDKVGLKKNSLFGTEVSQTQADIEEFSEKIRAGKKAQRTRDFMICARIESLILERGMEDAIERAKAFTLAGADAIMIHSRKKDPSEIITFVKEYRKWNKNTPLVVVPTSFNEVTEKEFEEIGINIVIYANQLTRSSFPAMERAAKSILEHGRAKECDEFCLPFKDIIRLIREDY